MNVFRLVVALVFLAAGLIVGIWNTESITLSLPFTTGIKTSSGAAIILSLLSGVVIGGLIVLATVVWPLYAKLRKANKQVSSSAPPSVTGL
jgi:uncharacterized integral membrane protein